RSSGVVVGQTYQREGRQLLALAGFLRRHKAGKFAQEFVYSKLVRKLDLEVRKMRIEMATQVRLGGNVLRHQRNCVLEPAFSASHRCRDIFSGLDLAPLALGRASGRRTSGGWRVFLLKLLAPNGLDVLAVVPVGHFVLR